MQYLQAPIICHVFSTKLSIHTSVDHSENRASCLSLSLAPWLTQPGQMPESPREHILPLINVYITDQRLTDLTQHSLADILIPTFVWLHTLHSIIALPHSVLFKATSDDPLLSSHLDYTGPYNFGSFISSYLVVTNCLLVLRLIEVSDVYHRMFS